MRDCIAYIILDGDQRFLMVLDQEAGAVTRSPISLKGLARLASEAAQAVNGELGGYNRIVPRE